MFFVLLVFTLVCTLFAIASTIEILHARRVNARVAEVGHRLSKQQRRIH